MMVVVRPVYLNLGLIVVLVFQPLVLLSVKMEEWLEANNVMICQQRYMELNVKKIVVVQNLVGFAQEDQILLPQTVRLNVVMD